MNASPQALIALEGVSFAYGNGPAVLEDLDFRVREGEFLGLIGPNGGGKSTLLRLILGLEQPRTGTVTVLGRPASQLGRDRRLLGYVPQDTTVKKEFPATVYDVALMGTYAGLGWFRGPGKAEETRVLDLLAQVGLQGLEQRPASALSGGQQQRLAIARALAAQPQLLLLDEPTSGLDTGGQSQLFNLLKRLKEQHTLTVVMVSHDVSALAHYADQLACLNKRLHWHDRSEMISEEVLRHVYACELDAFFIAHRQHLADFHGEGAPAGHAHGPHCNHDHGAANDHSHGDGPRHG